MAEQKSKQEMKEHKMIHQTVPIYLPFAGTPSLTIRVDCNLLSPTKMIVRSIGSAVEYVQVQSNELTVAGLNFLTGGLPIWAYVEPNDTNIYHINSSLTDNMSMGLVRSGEVYSPNTEFELHGKPINGMITFNMSSAASMCSGTPAFNVMMILEFIQYS